MSFDQNESVERTLEEILAELDLLPSPAARETSVSETPVSGISVSETPVSETSAPKAPVSELPAAAPDEEDAGFVETVPLQPKEEPETHRPMTVSVVTEQARPAAPEAEKAPAPAAEETQEEVIDEPSTVVFSPSRLREQIRAAASAAVPAARPKAAPPSSASLKAELEQRSRLGAGHTLTEQLRAQDPIRSAVMPKKQYQTVKKAEPVREDVRPEPAKKNRVKLTGWKKELVDNLKALAIVAAALFVVFFVLTRFVYVQGDSMDPTLRDGDRLLVSAAFYKPENGDVVVTNDDNGLHKPLIKRVIAKSGQIVDMDEDGRLMINGLILDEYYLNSPDTDMNGLELPLIVPEGCVFLLGDNRAVSADSRSEEVGMIPEEELTGKVLIRYWPLNRIGIVK